MQNALIEGVEFGRSLCQGRPEKVVLRINSRPRIASEGASRCAISLADVPGCGFRAWRQLDPDFGTVPECVETVIGRIRADWFAAGG